MLTLENGVNSFRWPIAIMFVGANRFRCPVPSVILLPYEKDEDGTTILGRTDCC